MILQSLEGLYSADQNALKYTDFNEKFRKLSGSNSPPSPFSC